MFKPLRYLFLTAAIGWSQNVSPLINPVPTREFGQPTLPLALNSIAPNLVEGRELYQPYSVAFDTSTTPPILYVVDSLNNRVLAYKNPYGLGTCGINNPTCGFADLVIGPHPNDFQYTLPGGPGNTGLNTGFNTPLAAVVDSSGNLYVLDAGNNRILRFPSPFKQTGSLLIPDLVIGQKSFSAGTVANMGQPAPSAQTLYFASGGTLFSAGMALEPSTGALWVTDPGNNRALRYPASQLAAGTQLPSADLVVGQTNFVTGTTATIPSGTAPQLLSTALYQPTGIAFDQKDRLYIADGQSGSFYRVMVYVPGFGIGMGSTRILGLVFQLAGQTQAPTFPNQYALIEPSGLFTTGNNLWVCDAGDNRVVEYDVLENWPPPPVISPGQPLSSQVSPPMLAVFGQNDLQSGKPNKGQAQPDNSTVTAPFGGAVNGTDIWIADTANNRVLDFPQQSGGKYTTAARVVGQLDFPYNAPNLIEGREVNFSYPASLEGVPLGGGGIAVDHNSNPPHVYIADTANNRILCFNSVYSLGQSSAAQADMIIGQSGPGDYYDWLFNYPLNDPTTMSQTGLSLPTDVLVDPAGNLWVADLGNGRVLRFPAPFSQPAGTQIKPNLVLGQYGFTGTPVTDPSQETMASPFGLAMFSTGSLAVSDAGLNRILIFTHPAGGDFQSSQPATTVLGQTDFVSNVLSNSNSGLYSPRHIAVDTSDRLYVADSGNDRLVVWDGTQTSTNGSNFSLQLPTFNQPQGVKVSSITGEVWLADSNNHNLYRLPEYDTLILETTPTFIPVTAKISTQTAPLAVELDNSDNVIIAESANRVTLYYAALAYQNAASFNSQPLAPGQLTLLYRYGLGFNSGGRTDFPVVPAPAVPPALPLTAGDIQIFVNGIPAPIMYLSTIDIAFQVPSSAPTSGTATILVQHASTGEILGTISAQMGQVNPGFFTHDGSGAGQLAATNLIDGTANTSGNPVARGQQIAFYLTGAGAFPGVADGTIPSSPVNTPVAPQILSSAYGGQVPAADIQYSGTSFYPGLWQINFLVDDKFPPGQNVITVLMNGVGASLGPSGPITLYFYAK